LNADGSFTYTPTTYFNGVDHFSYKASDGQATSNTAVVTITVNHVNQPPVAENDAYSTPEDTPLVVTQPTDQGGTSLAMTSDKGDFIGQGKTYSFGPSNGTFSMYNPYPSNPAYTNAVTISFSNSNFTEWWFLDFQAPNDARFVPGTTYTGAARFPFQSNNQ